MTTLSDSWNFIETSSTQGKEGSCKDSLGYSH